MGVRYYPARIPFPGVGGVAMLQLTIAALLGLVSLTLPHVEHPPVSYTQFQRITEGMSTKEVATLIGSTPDDHRTDGSLWPRFPIPTWYSRQQTWWGDEGVILIGVGEDGKVDHMGFVGMERDFNV